MEIFAPVSSAAAKSDSEDSEEETKSSKSKKKSTASSASMFQTTTDKDKDKKTKKKGRFNQKILLHLSSEWHVCNKFAFIPAKAEESDDSDSEKEEKSKKKKGKGKKKKVAETGKMVWLFKLVSKRWANNQMFLLQERSPSPEIEFDDLEKFVMQPAPQGVTIKCRVTRDQRGMDKSLYPLYYLHLDNEKKVRVLSVFKLH